MSKSDHSSAILERIRKITSGKYDNYYFQLVAIYLDNFNDKAICLMPDGRSFLYITEDNEIVKESIFGDSIDFIAGFDEDIEHLDTSLDEKVVSCCFTNGDIQLVDKETGENIETILNKWDESEYQYTNYEAFFTPNSKFIIRRTLDINYGRLDIWDLENKILHHCQEFDNGDPPLAISPNSKYLAISDSDKIINIINLKSR